MFCRLRYVHGIIQIQVRVQVLSTKRGLAKPGHVTGLLKNNLLKLPLKPVRLPYVWYISAQPALKMFMGL